MKSFVIAIIILILSISAISVNSFAIRNIIDNTLKNIKYANDATCDNAYIEYSEIYSEFLRKETYISLTVSHDDLTSIEDAFSEIIGAAKAGDRDGVITTKSRLENALKHLRRLSGINIDSIL